jgi:DNA-directed RNA polymerase specialized sigma24 family protein
MRDLISDILNGARRRWPMLADDIEQEMLLAAWLASKASSCRWYIRLRARGALLDYLRSHTKSRRVQPPQFLDIDVDELAGDFRDPVMPVELDRDLALLCAVVLNDQKTVAMAFGVKAPRMSRKVKTARGRVSAQLETP